MGSKYIFKKVRKVLVQKIFFNQKYNTINILSLKRVNILSKPLDNLADNLQNSKTASFL